MPLATRSQNRHSQSQRANRRLRPVSEAEEVEVAHEIEAADVVDLDRVEEAATTSTFEEVVRAEDPGPHTSTEKEDEEEARGCVKAAKNGCLAAARIRNVAA